MLFQTTETTREKALLFLVMQNIEGQNIEGQNIEGDILGYPELDSLALRGYFGQDPGDIVIPGELLYLNN